MLDHVSITVSDLKRSRAFWDATMEALGELFGHDAVGNEFADGIQARIDAVDIQQRLQSADGEIDGTSSAINDGDLQVVDTIRQFVGLIEEERDRGGLTGSCAEQADEKRCRNMLFDHGRYPSIFCRAH